MSTQTVRILWHVIPNKLGSHTDTHTDEKDFLVDVHRKGQTDLHKEAKKKFKKIMRLNGKRKSAQGYGSGAMTLNKLKKR